MENMDNKILLGLFFLIFCCVDFGDCNKSANEQCLNRILPNKQLQDVKWGSLLKEAIQNDNQDYQCFILCGLSNLKILRADGSVETENNPLASEIGQSISECAKLKRGSNACVNAKEAILCLFKSPLSEKEGPGKIIKEANENFKNSGQLINW
uniref:Allergen Cul o 13 n=1 Tax=Culicoides obsoletus TaxID=289301 RepID=A0A7U3MHS7_CULOB|nr:allergen Cul o 13 [Culicoides obsoletus]